MIRFEAAMVALGRRGRAASVALSLEATSGMHALLGPRDQGGPSLLAAAAGAATLRGGRVTVLDQPARPRGDVAWVPLGAELVPTATVAELLVLGARLRGGPIEAPEARLDRFGLASLAARRISSLDAASKHTLALIEAITSMAKVLLLDEPLARVDARAAAALVEALRERAKIGLILVATASLRDARALGATIWALGPRGFRRADESSADEALAGAGAMRVMGTDLRSLAAALASDARASGVTWSGPDLVVSGKDAAAIAAAIGDAVASSGAAVELLEPIARPPEAHP